MDFYALYLIEILHQTTTTVSAPTKEILLYLIEILHQTTTLATVSPFLLRCILSKFYIKPQLYRHLLSPDSVVSYRNSTSNHNVNLNILPVKLLYLIEILHQTTTVDGCAVLVLCVVSYRNSTSNHNPPKRKAFVPMLYLIEILHQTTTMPRRVLLHGRCILSKFYIKPQLKFFSYICGVRILHLITIRLYAEGFQPIVSAYSVETFYIS